jgi:hypothetical protein
MRLLAGALVSLKTARALGLSLPRAVLVRAIRVAE